MAAYLNKTDAAARLLSRYGITATVNDGDLDLASDEIDAFGPFIGAKQTSAQARAFPRTLNPNGSANGSSAVPDQILDAVSLLAYHIGSDTGPAVSSESALDRSVSYAVPKIPQNVQRVVAALAPFQLAYGARL